MRSTWATLLFAFCLTSSSYVGLGCSDCRVSGQDPVVYKGGRTNAAKTVYESTPADATMLHFPQGRTYQFYHGLGKIPLYVPVYVSFCERLTDCGKTDDKTNPNSLALAAGNLALIEVWNDEMIQIRNDTCENNFYMRVVIMADQSDDGAGGAGGDNGADASNEGDASDAN